MVEWRSVFVTVAIILLCFFAIPIKISNVEHVEERAMFDSFMRKYNKSYPANSEEYETRFKIFQEALEQIKTLNSHQDDSSPTVFYGITKFADINRKEFDDKYLTYEHKNNSHGRRRVLMRHNGHERSNRPKRSIGDGLPRHIDWRDKGYVSKIKNQKTCGACWAFSTIGVIESMVAMKTGVLKTFSTQEIIDCARYGNMGCDGGDTCNLLQWLVDNDVGIQEEKEYPLLLKTGTCKLKQPTKGVHVASNFSCDYLVGEENTLLALLAYHGPVAVAVNALTWQYYLGGVIQFHCEGGLESLNHAVQLVGYNLDGTPPYYIARNSWGTSFGEKGYLKIAIGSNVCGVASEVAALDVLT
uniref:Cysteine-type endopeptidase n=1 Tax=Riptortus pedestris TaxID=329032 RepID=R4WDB3_RIPPE|nr:cysteine-type endopeptidase [Riptortus pedestris]